jgi:uncharacterized protein (TIGR03435 family)
MRLLSAITLLATFTPLTHAQQPPTFEVATIKPSDPNKVLPPMLQFPLGSFQATGMTLRQFIAMAYQLPFDTPQIIGGPPWISSERFDVMAKYDDSVAAQISKLPANQQRGPYRTMVEHLLADRFKLRIHRETRELPSYTLVLANSGAKLKLGVIESNLPDNVPQSRIAVPGSGSLAGHNASLEMLTKVLSAQSEIGGRSVVDKTGLSGSYDFTLKWSPDATNGAPSAAAEIQKDLPSLFTALQEQLGLRLTSGKSPLEVIVVDSAEPPSEN